MKLTFDPDAWADYLYWQSTDRTQIKRINALIKDILRSPYDGIGQPEALKYDWSGYWSRRIDQEHRIIYRVLPDAILIAQCRFHY